MQFKKYLIRLVGVLFFTVLACDNKDISNPVLTDADLTVYFWGEGDNVTGIAWEGYDVLIGESKTVQLQVSPYDNSEVKWVDDATGDVLSTTLEYTFAPKEEEQKRVNFIVTRPSGYEKVIVFNFRGNLAGYTSKINDWQSVLIPEGTQTGTFTAEFDMIPSKDIMDGVVGILDGVSTTYADNSCLVRFNSSGNIDAYNNTGYAADNELTYHAGITYHVRLEVDAVKGIYDIYVTEQGGEEVVIGEGFGFRRKITHLDYWSMVSGDFNLDDPGTLRVLNMKFTVHSQNQAPVFTTPIEDLVVNEGKTVEVEIQAIDPLGGSIKLEAPSLPRFATFEDQGFGKGVITFKPYGNCGGCDLGLYDIDIKATNSIESTNLNFKIEIIDPNAGFDIKVNAGDATLWSDGVFDSTYSAIILGHTGAGAGGDGHVVGILPFALPSVPEGKKIKSAILKVNVVHNSSWFPVEYDVYGLSVRASAEVLPSDYFVGAYGTDASATAIQKAYMTESSPVGEEVKMSDVAGKELAAFLNSQYSNGSSEGEFVFIRINPNRNDMPTWAQLNFDSGEFAASETVPTLFVTLEDE